MKTFIALLVLFVCMGRIHAQNSKVDSLNNLIAKAKTDTGRINLINQKITLLNQINLDSAISLSKKTIEESKRLDYKKGEADARQRLASGFCFKGTYDKAAENLDAAEKIYTDLNDSTGLAASYSVYGMMYGMQSKYDSAIIYLEKSILIAELLNAKKILNRAYQNIGISYQMQSNYPKALEYFQKALASTEKENDINGQAYITVNMGLTYINMGDTTRAEQSLLKAIGLSKTAGIKNVELYAYTNLATLYDRQKKNQKSYEFAIKAATLGGEMGDQGIKAASLSKAATSLAKLKNFAKAEEMDKQAIQIADSSQQPLNIYQAYSAMGLILKMQEKYKDAIPYYEKGFGALKDADLYDEYIGERYLDLSECYEKTGRYDKALTAYKKSAEIRDSISSKENIRKATELTLNFEFEKKQQVAQAEQQRKNAVTKSRQLALLIGLGLTFILAIVAFNGYRNKQKANALLRKQKAEIQITLSELRTTQAQLIQSEKMASLGELTAGIAHEIQNPLNFVNNFSEVNTELIEEMYQEIDKGNIEEVKAIANDIKENEQKINHHGKRADAIVKGMLQHSRSSTGVKEPTDINTLADEYLRLAYHGLRAKDKSFNATMKTAFDERIGKINIIPQDIGRVILNLITNAFYAVTEKKKQKGESYEPIVTVSTKKVNSKVEITVKDNGMGIPQKVIDKIFQPFFSTKPTGEGTGLGLSISYDIITKAHGGELKVETKEGEGAEFIILLPV